MNATDPRTVDALPADVIDLTHDSRQVRPGAGLGAVAVAPTPCTAASTLSCSGASCGASTLGRSGSRLAETSASQVQLCTDDSTAPTS